MAPKSLFQLGVLLFQPLVLPVYSQFYFIVPPPPGKDNTLDLNPWYDIGQDLNITWNSTPTDYISIAIHQRQNVSGLTYFPWTITTKKNLTESNTFYLDIYPDENPRPTASSRWFNLSDPSTSSSAIPSPTATFTGSSSSSSGLSEPTQTAIPTKPDSSSAGSNSLDTGAKVALGLGIPLAVTVGALAGILIARRFRRKKVIENSVIGYPVPIDKSNCQMMGPAELENTARKLEPVEMPTDNH
ncbi:hypothetical protein BDV41DRAFT_570360 [Aspergillus transmontanensis]|uniref:Mid2 domain-containing protein n=1 Tax=Aspergillus transmontanensis TaxID=1034304 RepID=A0A5N6WH59_9EURO|nr:hypothetical protein BDV41DRAFT_570360 [Aspergillus transmontanensis]